jgi:N-carbamoylputrescine amidase
VPNSGFTVGLVQMVCSDDPADNLAAAVEGVRQGAQAGAQILCLPELFRSRYFCQSEDVAYFGLAEMVPGPTTRHLSALAAELAIVLVAPVFERRAAGVYHNTVVVIDADGRLLGRYRKTHIPDDPLYYEKFYFTPGDLGYPVFDTRYARVGPLICWDQWFPEAARLSALAGAELLVYPSAIGWHPAERTTEGATQRESWRTMQRAHAIANGVFVAAANRVGHEGPTDSGLTFWGSSFACAPDGQILADGAVDAPEVVLATCDRDAIERQRQGWPFLRDRRIDTYRDLTRCLVDERTASEPPSDET